MESRGIAGLRMAEDEYNCCRKRYTASGCCASDNLAIRLSSSAPRELS